MTQMIWSQKSATFRDRARERDALRLKRAERDAADGPAMTEPSFFRAAKSFTIAEIVTLTGAQPAPGVPLDRCISNVAALDAARPPDVTFLAITKPR